MSVRLPIYRLTPELRSSDRLREIVSTLFGGEPPKLEERDDAVVASSDDIVAEADLPTGGIWAADQAQLWNASQQPSLVSPKEAYSVAADLLARAGVMPDFGDDGPFTIVELPPGAQSSRRSATANATSASSMSRRGTE